MAMVGATEPGSERVSIKKQNASYRMVISFAGNRIGAIARTMGTRSMPHNSETFARAR